MDSFPFATLEPATVYVSPAIPAFAPRTPEERAADPYDRSFHTVDIYTGLAFGHLLFEDGGAEGLYRTLEALVLSGPRPAAVLDAGCGVGRLLYDLAPVLPATAFCGIDYAYNMCLRADQLLRGREPVPLPAWEVRGRPGVVFEPVRQLGNVAIAQANAEDLPFPPMTFDTVIAALLLCRLRDPLRGLSELIRVLRPGGRLLLATPLGFSSAAAWELLADSGRMRELVVTLGLRVDEWFDGLRYTERIDAHGNTHEWNVRVVAATLLC